MQVAESWFFGLDEDHTTLLSGVGLFALLSQEQLGRIAHGIPTKSLEVDEHVFTPTYRGEVCIVVKDAEALGRIADEVA
jgi:hypothetical protein